MNLDEPVPNFAFQATNNISACLNDFKGQNLILYFYPKDSTPGCTREGQDFRDAFSQFQALNTCIFGISRDSLQSHEKFKTKQNFPFELISDQQEQLCELFDVIKRKSLFSKLIRGIERSTFLIDINGVLRAQWRSVSVKGHVNMVLSTLSSLRESQ